jgi:hypothetical protein
MGWLELASAGVRRFPSLRQPGWLHHMPRWMASEGEAGYSGKPT